MQAVYDAANAAHLRGMRSAAVSLLAQMPAGDVIGRLSFEAHIEELERVLADWDAAQPCRCGSWGCGDCGPRRADHYMRGTTGAFSEAARLNGCLIIASCSPWLSSWEKQWRWFVRLAARAPFFPIEYPPDPPRLSSAE